MRDRADAAAILASGKTISDKIRGLAAAGYSRTEIADLIDRSYQQVRQVLVGDERRARRRAPSNPASGPARTSPVGSSGVEEAGEVWRLQLEADGVVRLPILVQAGMGVEAGSVLICELQGDGLKILTPAAAGERARAMLAGLAPTRMLSEELIAERRVEAEREDLDG